MYIVWEYLMWCVTFDIDLSHEPRRVVLGCARGSLLVLDVPTDAASSSTMPNWRTRGTWRSLWTGIKSHLHFPKVIFSMMRPLALTNHKGCWKKRKMLKQTPIKTDSRKTDTAKKDGYIFTLITVFKHPARHECQFSTINRITNSIWTNFFP